MAADLSRQIRKNAAGPKRAKGDSAELEQHSLGEQIAADRYLASKAAVKSKRSGMKISKLVPPGAT